jgi:ribonuclease HII
MPLVTAGLDEVGIGALSGPYISVVAVFREKDLTLLPTGVKDSKKTSEEQRGLLYLPICNTAFDVGIGHAWPWEIDRMGPSAALQLCYRRALGELKTSYDVLYIDGNVGVESFKDLFRPGRIVLEPKADARYREVSAASIIAKWARDEMMISYGKRFPQYDWKENKGYGTKAHEDAIRAHGLLVDENDANRYIHRKHYCKKFIYEGIRHAGI